MTRQDAYTALLQLPDEPCLPRRGRVYTYARDPKRDPWQIKRALGIAYVEHQRQAWTGGDISCVVSVRRRSPLRLARRAGSGLSSHSPHAGRHGVC